METYWVAFEWLWFGWLTASIAQSMKPSKLGEKLPAECWYVDDE